ncbi:hypothetical protein P4310_11485 [Bacillus thuringiensis]|uniref:hypothetical protein n=1 Tax=Bacillus cereus group TaxID=86661 RepID=UPI000A3C45BF|nr:MULTISPECIES: hypothetical protein [Bacillus cereus group]MED3066167.1 hypothetical protein [Bacillus thuringiensis]OUB30361.1 hypothetical protein BK737_18560 [Bacillus thuringiensis serovar palmanyolensis]
MYSISDELRSLIDSGRLPKAVGKSDRFEVINYSIIIRNSYELHNAARTPNQDYEEIHKRYEQYISKSSTNSPSLFNEILCPLYFITVIDNLGESFEKKEEVLTYIGSTYKKTHRFKEGHIVSQKLLDPFFNNMTKKLYFAQILITYRHKKYFNSEKITVPIEWLKPYDFVEDIIIYLEYLFIHHLEHYFNIKRTQKLKYKNLKEYSAKEIKFEIDHNNGVHSTYFEKQSIDFMKYYKLDVFRDQLSKELAAIK